MTPDLRDRLKSVRSALEEKRSELQSLAQERDSAKEKFASSSVPVTEMTQSPDFKAAEQAVKKHGECADAIADLTQLEVSLLGMMGDSQRPSDRGPNGPGSPGAELARGWNPEAVLQGDAYKRFVDAGMPSTKTKFGSVLFGQLADRESAADFLGRAGGGGSIMASAHEVGTTAVAGAIPADNRGVQQPVLRRLTLLDLIPTGTTDSNIVEYVQVITIPSSANVVAEGAVKPEQRFDTEDADAPVRTIAGWIKVRKQALADYAGLRTLLGTLLPYDVRRQIEHQILAGDGTGQNLLGLLNQPNIGAPDAVAGDNPADAILRAITVIVLSDADPDFVALHPLTWQDLLLMRENQADRTGAYLYGAPNVPQAPTIWGLSITSSRVVPEETPIVGDSTGATLLVREGVNVLASDSDQDDFVRNRATLLAEARVAFPVWRPTSFSLAPVPTS
jgi:HK97 family phage major capsid protein